MKQSTVNKKLGIVLSGGSARGFAHLGVLQALEENGISPYYVAGTSMGAVIGSIYAAGVQPKEIYEFACKQKYIRLFKPAFSTSGIIKATFLGDMLNELIPHNNFEQLQKKFFISVTNLNNAKNEIIISGDLKKAVCASAAIPFVFEPIVMNGKTYVDGGVLNNLPVNALTTVPECEKVIGVSVISTKAYLQKELKGFNAIMRSIFIAIAGTEMQQRELCDFFIEVSRADELGLFDFSKVDEYYKIGYLTTIDYIKKNSAIKLLADS